jgi:hypothetical protein
MEKASSVESITTAKNDGNRTAQKKTGDGAKIKIKIASSNLKKQVTEEALKAVRL